MLSIMRIIYGTIVRVANEFDFDPSFSGPDFNFQNTAAGGWEPPIPTDALGRPRKPKPPPKRSRWFQGFNPLLLPTPMRLY
jgi:hypothetical protein